MVAVAIHENLLSTSSNNYGLACDSVTKTPRVMQHYCRVNYAASLLYHAFIIASLSGQCRVAIFWLTGPYAKQQ